MTEDEKFMREAKKQAMKAYALQGSAYRLRNCI